MTNNYELIMELSCDWRAGQRNANWECNGHNFRDSSPAHVTSDPGSHWLLLRQRSPVPSWFTNTPTIFKLTNRHTNEPTAFVFGLRKESNVYDTSIYEPPSASNSTGSQVHKYLIPNFKILGRENIGPHTTQYPNLNR